MSRLRGTWLALLVLPVLAGCATADKDLLAEHRLQAESAYEQGVKAFNQAQYAMALTQFKQAIALDGSVAAYWDVLGRLYLQMGRPDLALPQLQRAVELEPKYADAKFHLGVAFAEGARWGEAVDWYRQAIAMPTLTVPDQAHHNLGVALFNLGRYPEAEAEVRFALSLDPGMQAGYYTLGLILGAEDRKDAAKAAFLRARQLSPDSPFGRAALDRLRAMGDGG